MRALLLNSSQILQIRAQTGDRQASSHPLAVPCQWFRVLVPEFISSPRGASPIQTGPTHPCRKQSGRDAKARTRSLFNSQYRFGVRFAWVDPT